ncbi:MAG: hypothetical protein AAGN66_11900 [Acidobacteriota bacterium]
MPHRPHRTDLPRRRSRPRWRDFGAAVALVLLLASGPAAADGDGTSDPTVEEILALQAQIEALLETLPPELRDVLRDDLRRRLEDTGNADPPATDDAGPSGVERADTSDPEPAPAVVAPEPTDSAETTAPAPLEEAAPEVEAPEVEAPEARVRGRSCRALAPFDSDADGKLTALDRHWRHAYLWTDDDRDGQLSEDEVESLYERGVREVALSLRSFVKGKGKKAASFEIEMADLLIFDVRGNGFSTSGYGPTGPAGDDGALAFDFDRVSSGGGPEALDAEGRPVTGLKALRPDWRIDGVRVDCR